MKTRTAAFDPAWSSRRSRKAIYKITYKRRYWNGSAYVLESTAKTLRRREIDRISGLSWKLDTPHQNRILPANVSLVLLDKSWKWLPTNTANGVWRRGGESPTLGFDPIGSEFTISYGYITDSDGTEEYLAQFTGLVQDDPRFDSTSGTVTLNLLEKSAAKLEACDAQKVCEELTDQATDPATGDGSNAIFAMLTSVWRAFNIRVAAALKTQGTHYTLEKLNDAEEAAEIDLSSAVPTAGQTVLWDGSRWYRDKSIKELVELICDAAGITSGMRSIAEPLFSGVASSKDIDSEAHFAAGTVLTNISTAAAPGSAKRKWFLIDDFADGDFTASPVWSSNGAIAPTIVSNKLRFTGASNTNTIQVSTPLTKRTGTWEFKVRYISGDGRIFVGFINQNQGNGYSFIWQPGTTLPDGELANVLEDYPSNQSIGMSGFALSGTTEKTIRLTRDSGGIIKCYVDGVLKGTSGVTREFDATRLSIQSIGFTSTEADGPVMEFDDFYYSEEVDGSGAVSNSAATFESAVQDLLSTPSVWGTLDRTAVLNGGTITYYTATSADGISFDAYVEVVDGVIASTLRRYIKVKAVLAPASGSYVSPELQKLTINYSTSELFIKSADFTGLNGLQAIQELAIMGGMEFGSEGDGTFFFRAKNASATVDLSLSQKNAIIAVQDYQTGYREVKNVAQVRYGKSGTDGYYFSEYKASTAGEASPTTAERFGERVLSLDLQRFIFANNANVADAIARKLYELNYRPKRRLKLRCRIVPHLDLSDTVKINFHDSPLIEKAIFGDPLQRYPVTGPNSRTLARDIIMKVIGHSPDVMKSESVLDLEEIL